MNQSRSIQLKIHKNLSTGNGFNMRETKILRAQNFLNFGGERRKGQNLARLGRARELEEAEAPAFFEAGAAEKKMRE